MRYLPKFVVVLVVMQASLAVGQSAAPPAFLESDLLPGRLTAVRADTAGNVSAVGIAAGGFGCGAGVTRNGYYLGIEGRIVPLCPLAGDLESTVSGFAIVNGVPLVVGRTIDASLHERPAVWSRNYDGTFTGAALPLPIAGGQGIAVAVDSFGRITGDVENGGHRVPAYWPSSGALPTLFPTDGVGQGRSIRDFSGEPAIAGVINDHVMVWYPNRTQDDTVRYPLGTASSSDARALRNLAGSAAVGGSQTRTDGSLAPIVFTGTSTVGLPPLAGGSGKVFDMTPGLTAAVGNATAADGGQHAVLWRAGGVSDLNDLLLSVCRGNNEDLCVLSILTNANAISSNGAIAAQAMQSGILHGVLLQPVGPLTWGLDACASIVTFGPGCTVSLTSPRFASTSQFATTATFPASAGIPGGDYANSVAQARTAQASASSVRNAAEGDAIFQNFVVIEPLSLARLIAPGESRITLNFHFAVSATAQSCPGPFSDGAVIATMTVKAPDGTVLSHATGNISFTNGSAPAGSGVFTSFPTINPDQQVAVSLSAASTTPIVLLVEGRANAGFSSGFGMPNPRNVPSCGSGNVSVVFHANNPAAITLSDGTTLASHSVRYAAWPGRYAN